MTVEKYSRMPRHIGIIPDGNRRWAKAHNMAKEKGYEKGIAPGLKLYELCIENNIEELTFYGFTVDNTKRPSIQTRAFQKACIDAVKELSNRHANLLVVGNTDSPLFPKKLLPYTKERICFGDGLININFLVNYGWNWDLNYAINNSSNSNKMHENIASKDISRMELVMRWGGRRRLSGFLPVQSVYSDFYIVEDYWPDFKDEHFYDAITWYQTQDITLGG